MTLAKVEGHELKDLIIEDTGGIKMRERRINCEVWLGDISPLSALTYVIALSCSLSSSHDIYCQV
jgi:hypothetical protein